MKLAITLDLGQLLYCVYEKDRELSFWVRASIFDNIPRFDTSLPLLVDRKHNRNHCHKSEKWYRRVKSLYDL